MDTRAKIREVLKQHYGEFKTNLEHQYEDKITENLSSDSFQNRDTWATYNQVLLELKHSLKDMLRVKAVLYHLTDDSEPNQAIIQVMEDVKTSNPEMERLYWKIMNF